MTRAELISSYTNLNRRFETIFLPKVKRTLDNRVKQVIQVLKDSGVHSAIKFIHDDLAHTELTKVIQQLYVTVGVKHAQIEERRLRQEVARKGIGFNETWTKWILNYLRQYLIQKITFDVSATTRAYLLNILNESIIEGWGLDTTVSKLEDQPYTKIQAARIVRTEINRASNVGFRAQADSFDYELQKMWISIHDNRTRGNKPSDHANHIALDGTLIDLEQDYVDRANGDHLQQPGDPNASAASTINCRCRIVTKAKRDQDGNLIPKPNSAAVIFPRRVAA